MTVDDSDKGARELMLGLKSYLLAESYEAKCEVVEKTPVLLSPAAEKMLADTFLTLGYENNEYGKDLLALLARAREVGPQNAVGELIEAQDSVFNRVALLFAATDENAMIVAVGPDFHDFLSTAIPLIEARVEKAPTFRLKFELLLRKQVLRRYSDHGSKDAFALRCRQRDVHIALGTLVDASGSFVHAIDVISHNPVLLDADSRQLLNEIVGEIGDEGLEGSFRKFIHLINQCAEHGVAKSCAIFLNDATIQPAIEALCESIDNLDLERTIEKYPVLLTEPAIQVFLGKASVIPDVKLRQLAVSVALLLRRIRLLGYESAFLVGGRAVQGINKLMRATNWDQIRDLFFFYPELLIEENGVEHVIDDVFDHTRNQRFRVHLLVLRELLTRCQQTDVESAFRSFTISWPSFKTILSDKQTVFWKKSIATH